MFDHGERHYMFSEFVTGLCIGIKWSAAISVIGATLAVIALAVRQVAA